MIERPRPDDVEALRPEELEPREVGRRLGDAVRRERPQRLALDDRQLAGAVDPSIDLARSDEHDARSWRDVAHRSQELHRAEEVDLVGELGPLDRVLHERHAGQMEDAVRLRSRERRTLARPVANVADLDRRRGKPLAVALVELRQRLRLARRAEYEVAPVDEMSRERDAGEARNAGDEEPHARRAFTGPPAPGAGGRRRPSCARARRS